MERFKRAAGIGPWGEEAPAGPPNSVHACAPVADTLPVVSDVADCAAATPGLELASSTTAPVGGRKTLAVRRKAHVWQRSRACAKELVTLH